jgi:hypothetical protein
MGKKKEREMERGKDGVFSGAAGATYAMCVFDECECSSWAMALAVPDGTSPTGMVRLVASGRRISPVTTLVG